jgi:hypothetical protein
LLEKIPLVQGVIWQLLDHMKGSKEHSGTSADQLYKPKFEAVCLLDRGSTVNFVGFNFL